MGSFKTSFGCLRPRDRRALLHLLCIGLAALGASPASAQATNTSTASVEVNSDLRLTRNADLDFGQVEPGASGGTIRIAPNGTVTVTGSVTSLGGTQPAAFTMTRRIFIDYPTYVSPTTSTSIQIVHETDPTKRLTVNNFTTDFNRRGALGLPAYYFVSSYEFRVGGQLVVPANATSGQYTGTFTVTLNFP